MKTLLRSIFLLCIGMTAIRCTEHESPATVEKVQFTFNMRSSADDGARLNAVELPSNASVLVTIENSAGETVLDHHRIDLLKVGDKYMSKPIDLIAGNHKLVDFMIVNDEDEVLYAAPKHGSPLASAVTTPVPFSFYVSKDNVSNIPVEVVDVQGSTPEAFGYASFDISIKEGLPLQIAVLAADGNGYSLTAADASLLDGNDTIATFNLGAEVNTIFLSHGDSTTYLSLIVDADGYHPAQQWFRYNDLMEELDGSPLTIHLRPDTELRWTSYQIEFEVMVDTVDPSYAAKAVLEEYAEYYPNIPELPRYDGEFTIVDYASIDVTIDNDSAYVSTVAFNSEATAIPTNFSINETCRGLLPYGEILNISGGTGFVSYADGSPKLHLNIMQEDPLTFRVTFVCYFIDYGLPVLWAPGDYLSDFTMDLNDEDGYQTFYIRDSTIQVRVQPLGPYNNKKISMP